MTTSVRARPYVTLDAFYRMPHDADRVELANGVVVVSPAGSPAHGIVGRAIFRALDAHVTPRGLGEVFTDGFGYELPVPSRPDTMRVPDVSFVRADRMPRQMNIWRALPLAPDLAVEVLSPSNRRGELRAKLNDYLDAGTALVWVVAPRRRTVEVLTAGVAPGRGRVLHEDDVLEGGAVLPEFALPLRELLAVLDRYRGA